MSISDRPVVARRSEFLPFSPPAIEEDDIEEVVAALRSGWITTGPRVKAFETQFRDYLGAHAALALNSCTAGLHTALVASGIGPGDEVVTTTMTFAASVNVIEHVGARPVLVDVDPLTLNLDPEAVAAAVTPRTKAVLPVHYAGHPADMDPIEDIARAHRLAIIEDAAHALPARYKGRLIGSGPNPTAFSFYATKNLTTAEGGMLTGPPELLARARIVSLHGMSGDAYRRYEKGGSWHYDIVLPGFKYNMTDLQAAIGLRQLAKLERFQRRRREVVGMYDAAFAAEQALELPVELPHVEHAWHLYVIRLRPGTLRIDRAQFVRELASRNIGTSVHFIPIHLHPYYRDRYSLTPSSFPTAVAEFERMVSLPLHPLLDDRAVTDVIEAVLDVVGTFAR